MISTTTIAITATEQEKTMETNNPIAVDIYERIEMNKNGEGGSVWEDLYSGDELPTLQDFEDYFGDLDPIAFL